MLRVVCPSCKTGFEAAIHRDNYALNCVSCGVAFSAASFLSAEEYQAVRERQPGFKRAAESSARILPGRISSRVAESDLSENEGGFPLRPADPETRTAGLPFFDESSTETEAVKPDDSVRLNVETQTGESTTRPTSFFEASVTTSRFKPLSSAMEEESNGPSSQPFSTPVEDDASNGIHSRETAPYVSGLINEALPLSDVRTVVPERLERMPSAQRPSLERMNSTRQRNPGALGSGFVAASTKEIGRDDVRHKEESGKKVVRRTRPPLLEGSFGAFDIVAEIARGGVGAVFHAREKISGRSVALKVLLEGEEAGEVERERFRRECETAKALALPGMVEIYAVGEIEGKPYMAMELVEGLSLNKFLKAKPLSVNEGLVIMRAVSQTVGALHEAGYVHRDLKPANILIDGFGVPKVADFGLVRSLDEVTRLTAAGLVCGTPAYMSPEQARGDGDDVGPRSDVWALGAVLYELLTGAPPFKAENALRLMHKITKETPTPPDRINPKVPKEIQAIVLKCLEKNLERRYRNATGLAEDLGRFLDGQPVEAKSRSMQKIIRSAKENSGLWLAVGAGFAAVLLVAVLARIIFVPQEIEPLVEEGWVAVRANKMEEAKLKFREVLNLDAKNARAHLGFGMVTAVESIDFKNQKVRDYLLFNEALRLTSKAGRLDRSLAAESESQLARIYRSIGRRKDVVRVLERAVALEQGEPKYSQALGLAYWHLGKITRAAAEQEHLYRKALSEFENVLRLKADFAKTRDYIKLLRYRDLASRVGAVDSDVSQ